jgi:DNA-directed RNA polymerase specialized sigma24 family protein
LTRLDSNSGRAAASPRSGNGHGNGRAKKLTAAAARQQQRVRRADQALVDRCRAGDGAAWQEIHDKCHAHLVRQIRFTLGDRARDGNLVEEIAAKVWYGLIADNGYLLERFQPEKGSGLEKYLAAIARFEVLRHQRGEIRRRRREQETQAARGTSRNDHAVAEMSLDFQDFLPQLTPREREFFHCVLVGNSTDDLEISAPNAWQLRHRIRRKLLTFLGIE